MIWLGITIGLLIFALVLLLALRRMRKLDERQAAWNDYVNARNRYFEWRNGRACLPDEPKITPRRAP